MLTFEQKQTIIESFPQLTKKEISLNRLNYHYEDSLFEKSIVVEKLHPNGNGFVYVGDLLKYESQANDKGLVNIREFSEIELKEIITDAIDYLSEEIEEQPIIEVWSSREGTILELVYEKRNWNIYFNNNLEDSFGSKEAAVDYLREEGFQQKRS